MIKSLTLRIYILKLILYKEFLNVVNEEKFTILGGTKDIKLCTVSEWTLKRTDMCAVEDERWGFRGCDDVNEIEASRLYRNLVEAWHYGAVTGNGLIYLSATARKVGSLML